MKTMRESIKESVLGNVSRMIGVQAKGLVEEGESYCSYYFFDEPEMPRELLEYKMNLKI